MRILLTILLLLSGIFGFSQSLIEIRKEFHAAVLNSEESKAFHAYIHSVDKTSPTVLAYQAVSEAMLAQVSWNPFTKLSLVFKYDRLINEAVAQDEQNIEIRFLRLAIEYNLPSFLGLSTHMDEDLGLILENMQSVQSMDVDPFYGRYIFYWLEHSDLCTHEQIAAMKETLELQSSF
ncbi:MAG: hypothetical protein Tsb0034_02160 [Ekhidna sp.]